MRAIVCKEYGRWEDLELGEMEDPTAGPGEVLVSVRAAGINFPDLLFAQGKYQFKPELPAAPGGEAAGVVEAVGEGVERVRPGDEVIAIGLHGAYAEKWAVPEDSIIPIPKGLSMEVAAGIGITYGTSYYALKQRANLQAGETLLVLGAAGGVGTAAIEIGKMMGAKVIAAASTEEKLAVAREMGADETILYSQEPLKNRAKELTDGRGVDVIYDPVGGDYSEAALRAMAWNGRHLVIGFAAGEIPKIPLNLTLLKSCSVVGVFWGTWTKKDPAGSAENYTELGRRLSDGTLRPRVEALPAEQFLEGLGALAQRRATGKIVLSW